MKTEKSINRNILLYGIVTGVLFIIYFIAMIFLGLIEKLELSALNALILLVTANQAVKASFSESNRRLTFLEVFGLCIVISLLAYAILAVFMYIYLSYINPDFMTYLIQNSPMGAHMNSGGLAIFLMIQGGAIGFIISFILEQYHKRKTPENTSTSPR